MAKSVSASMKIAAAPKSTPLIQCYVEVNNLNNDFAELGAYKVVSTGKKVFDIGLIFKADMDYDSKNKKSFTGFWTRTD